MRFPHLFSLPADVGPDQRRLLILLGAAFFIGQYDMALLTLALPDIQASFAIPEEDLGRVIAFARNGPQDYRQVVRGVTESWHPISHHNNNPEKLEMATKINEYLMGHFASFLELRKRPCRGFLLVLVPALPYFLVSLLTLVLRQWSALPLAQQPEAPA